MPVDFDIKDAGILAGFEVWGWPWHGLCTSGVIDLGGGLTKTITTPAHGSAWLIDRALPAIERSPERLLADAALGHEWRNYGMVSGGSVHGTPIGENKFIHVDAAGERWLIGLTFSFQDSALQKVRVTLSIVRFGLFDGGVETPITVDVDVQCTYYTYASYGYVYTNSAGVLEDVWTNGSRFLVGIARQRSGAATPRIHDLYSVIEFTVSGIGGADGSGLVFDAVEVMSDTQLSAGSAEVTGLGVVTGLGTSLTQDSHVVYYDCVVGAPVGVSQEWFYSVKPVPAFELWMASSFDNNYNYSQVYARYAYYDSGGTPRAARLGVGYHKKVVYDSGSQGGVTGALQFWCGPTGSGDHTNTIRADATMTVSGSHQWGIFILENETPIDSLECRQTFQRVQDSILIVPSYAGIPTAVSEPGFGSSRTGILDKVAETSSAITWEGSLASLLSLGPPPASFGPFDTPLNVAALAAAWRDPTPSVIGAEADVKGGALLGLQRIDGKSAAFYKPGADRIYGTILTPLGTKTAPMTPAGNLYFAWQRKTNEFAFAVNPICWV
jgi:hypothetical protein